MNKKKLKKKIFRDIFVFFFYTLLASSFSKPSQFVNFNVNNKERTIRLPGFKFNASLKINKISLRLLSRLPRLSIFTASSVFKYLSNNFFGRG